MKVTLKPGLKGTLPLLWYFAFILPLATLTIFSRSIMLQIMFGGSALFVFMVFVRELVSRHGLRIELEDDVLILPVEGDNIHWPVDASEAILPLPGFEFEENLLVKAPYYDGKSRYRVPLENLTGVWVHENLKAASVVVFGTDSFDIQYDVNLFGQAAVEAFLTAHIPAGLRTPESKLKSVVYQARQRNLERLLQANQPVSATMKSRKGWIAPVFFGLVFGFFLVSGILTTNRQNLLIDSLFWLFWIAICVVIFLRLYGEREVSVDKKWIVLRVRQKSYKLHWKDVQYFTLQGKLILWGESGRLAIPAELLQSNKLLLNMLRVKHFAGELEARPILLDEFVSNR